MPKRQTKSKPREPLWKGPVEDGITFSLLSKFLVCRERFRLKVVEGLVEDEGFKHALEYGNFWHEAEEAHSGGKPWDLAIKRYRQRLLLKYPNDVAQIEKWFNVCKTAFPLYIRHWATHEDEQNRKPLLEEASFRVPYKLPSGRTVTLRGKFDCVFKTEELIINQPRKGDRKSTPGTRPFIYLQENKTKGEIDELGIQKTVPWNLQTMLYQIALRETTSSGHLPWLPLKKVGPLLGALFVNTPIAGTLYNVVRRPLSDRYAIRQKKQESMSAFYRRLGEEIAKKPEHYFMRWKVRLDDNDIQLFKDRVFHPILEQLLDWWEWIVVDPFDPWRPRMETDPLQSLNDNYIHFQAPWGVYNSLAGGFRGDYFEYLTSNREYSLTHITNLFPEL